MAHTEHAPLAVLAQILSLQKLPPNVYRVAVRVTCDGRTYTTTHEAAKDGAVIFSGSGQKVALPAAPGSIISFSVIDGETQKELAVAFLRVDKDLLDYASVEPPLELMCISAPLCCGKKVAEDARVTCNLAVTVAVMSVAEPSMPPVGPYGTPSHDTNHHLAPNPFFFHGGGFPPPPPPHLLHEHAMLMQQIQQHQHPSMMIHGDAFPPPASFAGSMVMTPFNVSAPPKCCGGCTCPPGSAASAARNASGEKCCDGCACPKAVPS